MDNGARPAQESFRLLADTRRNAAEATMNRRQLILSSTALGLAPLAAAVDSRTAGPATASAAGSDPRSPATSQPGAPLPVPAAGSIPVAFLVSDGAVVIDFCGPWEVFESVQVIGRRAAAFQLYTVAETTRPITASGGMKLLPNFTFKSAPPPKVVVIPAQSGAGNAALEWIRQVTHRTDVTMSVCTGAYVLARTGLLNGQSATTHHSSYSEFAMQFPEVRLVRGARFVEAGNLATSGGLSSGIDLSLRIVERYFGRDVATQTAYYMEYQGRGWMDPNSNQAYRTRRTSTAAHPLCPVCDMEVDPASAPRSVYHQKTYYFCMPAHKLLFDKAPQQFLDGGDS
jgi:putative intracellular protease/amidase/YHS domain-containing protein